jgi:tryptophan-rich sensory protein
MTTIPAEKGARVWFALVGFIAAAFVAGAIGSAATFENVRTWYPTLVKPSWNPPNWLFGPVWTTLYVFMGIAAWRAWRRRHMLGAAELGVRAVVKLYFVHLVANALWSILFFGLKQPAWALAEIVVLWAMIAWIQFRLVKIDGIAAALWAPYLAWVSFASFLNFTIVRLN